MKFNSFLKPFLFAITVGFFVSCDKDFNEIGADFVDNDHYNFATQKYDVIAYNQNLGPVQTNNLPTNALGYYDNHVFGRTTASFVTQLELASVNPTIVSPTLVTVDSVYLHIPYFSHFKEELDADGYNKYELDSIYGAGKIKLDVFRNNYYLRNLDANPISGLLEQQNYFSDQKSDFDANHDATRLNYRIDADGLYQNDNFEFKDTPIKFLKTDPTTNIPLVPNVVRERLAPGIYMDLKESEFKTNILLAGAANLMDNNAFKNYYRGLYFKVSSHSDYPNGAALAQLNFAQGKIVIVYKDGKSAAEPTILVRKTMTLNMKGFTVNVLENANNGTIANNTYNTAMGNIGPDDPTTGDSRLYLKGGQGSMAVIEIFGGKRNSGPMELNSSPDLNQMRDDGWIINEANLVFNIDDTPAGLGNNDIKLEANRIYLYDLTNKRPLIDYYFDATTSIYPKYNKLIHGGIVHKVSASARGTKYKIRITNHIRNLVRYGGANVAKDSTNVKLGLVVTESINSIANVRVKTPFSYIETNPNTGLPEVKNAKYIPAMSVINPLGTVLYGSSSVVPLTERLQLEIVYTKPD